jgi:hypothetical protein
MHDERDNIATTHSLQERTSPSVTQHVLWIEVNQFHI